MDGVELTEKDRWIEVGITHPYPSLSQWLEDDAVWPGYDQGAILPTCMKAIKRNKPPPPPAGINRVDKDGRLRWEADSFRFPPYQYQDRFLIWVSGRWRLISASERELLHGMGFDHTAICRSAGDIKKDPEGYEDARKTFVGDSFSCYSFAYIAATLCQRWVTIPFLWTIGGTYGMAPGFCCPIDISIPLVRRLAYGDTSLPLPVSALHSCLLRRVNHTGSDVRVASGAIMNPKTFPRQSAAADWWSWKKVFSYRWGKADHINGLELRSIIHAIEWRIKHVKEESLRIFHLTDSYVSMSVISKGRSSSKMLKPLLVRLSALLMAFDLYVVISHVESSDNPTDEASRH